MRPSIRCPKCGGLLSAPTQKSSDSQSLTCLSCGNTVLNPDALVGTSSDDDDWISLDTPVPPPAPAAKKTAKPSKDSELVVATPVEDEPLQVDGIDIVEVGDLFDDLPDTVPYPKNSPESFSPAGTSGFSPSGAAGSVARPGSDEYRVKCKVCDSISYARPSQAGTTMICTDCTSTILIPPPPVPKAKPVAALGPAALSVGPNAGDSKLSPMFSPAPTSGRSQEDPFRKSASDLLEKAERAEATEQPEDNNYDVPSAKEWMLSVFGVMKELTVFAHWLIFTVAGSLGAMFAIWTQHPVIVFAMFPFGMFFGLIVLSSGFAILQSASANLKTVEDWPTTDATVWFENGWIMAAATAISGAPIFLLNTFVFGPSLITFGMTLLSIFALFPFVLLSILDNGSVFMPFSAEVSRSVQTCKEPWGGLYFSSGVLFCALFFLAVILNATGSIAAIPILVAALVATVFIYFAMIGRLAFAIGQSLEAEKSE